MEYIIALGITFFIYFLVKFIGITKKFFTYNKIKKQLIYTTYSYLQQINLEYLNLDLLKEVISKRISKEKLDKSIDFIQLRWVNKNKFKVLFKLNFHKDYPIHKISFDINELKKLKDSNKNREVKNA
ncbi:MAG: hypothetical protein ACQEQE_05235 [Bacillota bacterium]